MGVTLHTRYSATRIIDNVAKELKKEQVSYLVGKQQKFSLLIDESTTLNKKSTLVGHLKSSVGRTPTTTMFLYLVELDSQTAGVITNSLLKCLSQWVFEGGIFKSKLGWLCM